MPKSDGYGQGINYPVLSDAPNIETAFQTVVNGAVARTILRFANANERAATLIGDYVAVPGMITYLIAEDRYDRRDGDGVWRPLSPGAWKPFTFASGYSARGGSPGYRIVNGEVQLRGTIQRSNGSDLTTGATTIFGTLPAEARPVGAYRYFAAAANFQTVNGVSLWSGRVGMGPNGEMNFLMPINAKSDWLALDGVRFSLD